jgi:uncharacterized membrane protein YccC
MPSLAHIQTTTGQAYRAIAQDLRPTPVVGHVLRTALAGVLALYLAYALELDSPSSAVVTVVLVTHPLSGAVVSKGFWRVVGTAIGAAAATLLMALFAQAPALFLGACVAVAALLRYFRSYAAVLSGYTVALVGFGAIDDPNHVFDLAMARLAVVCVGIGCQMLVSTLLAPGAAGRAFDARLAKAITTVAQCIVAGARGGSSPVLERQRTDLVAELHKLDELAEYAAAESADFAQRVDAVRAAIAALFSALTGSLGRNAPLDLLMTPAPSRPELSQTRVAMIDGLVQLVSSETDLAADAALARRHLAATIRRIAKIGRRVATVGTVEDLPLLVAIDQLREMLEQFITALDGVSALQKAPSQRSRIGRHIDWDPKGALVNAARAVIAVSIAGAFWIASQWPSGPLMLTWCSVICALLATRPNPVAASLNALRAVIWAALLGFPYTFGMLSQIDGFPLLAITLAIFIGAGAYLATKPGAAEFGTFFPVFIATLVAPTNPMHFDIAAYLNASFALVFGVGCAVLAFHVILPVNPAEEMRRSIEMILIETEALARNRSIPHPHDWENRQRRRLVRIANLPDSDEARRGRALDTAFAAIQIGRSLAAVLRLLDEPDCPPALHRSADIALVSLRRLRSAPREVAGVLSAQAKELTALAPEAGELRRGCFRIAAAFEEIATLTNSAVAAID